MDIFYLIIGITNFILSIIGAILEFIVFKSIASYWRWLKLALTVVLLNITVIYAFVLFDGGVQPIVLRIGITFLLLVITISAALRYIEIKTRKKDDGK